MRLRHPGRTAPPGAPALLLLALLAPWGAPSAQDAAPGPPPVAPRHEAPAPAPQTPSAQGATAPMPLMPLAEIHPGMIGTARTVFEGSNLEDFKVEILGVLKNAIGPQQDLIVGRLRGEKVEYTGVVSGMSGSPVYIDGRLIGAVSYRLGPFAKEAVAGITPIADMIKLAGPADKKRAAAQAPDLLVRRIRPALSGYSPHKPGNIPHGRIANAKLPPATPCHPFDVEQSPLSSYMKGPCRTRQCVAARGFCRLWPPRDASRACWRPTCRREPPTPPPAPTLRG